ncbi:HTTM domain-containing protein [Eisenibacter elegans]|jgi:hypothetical protein|uniref:HTTM domain-containing protein n=1 Tax=Eisenibacter elegans TaxID=997 RepID=UPI000419B4D7|nr:HTTM domain-containing protein [Eisenibacter elegans]
MPLRRYFQQNTSAYPLGVFRFAFGVVMAFGTLRFVYLGWIEDHYVNPVFHFKYWGFAWISPFSVEVLYLLHFIMAAAALGVALATGWLYRLSAVLLFLIFTYTELIDLTYYLNHYYFVSVISLLLCLIPAPPPPFKKEQQVPRWVIDMFKLQISIVYVYAGLAKINYDWLVLALPLKIWLPAHDQMPLIGAMFTWKITPYLFSWFGMLYDCTIPFWLMWRRTRPLAYLAVIVFHVLVGLLFQIGIFPLVMIGATLIFFDFEYTKKHYPSLPRTLTGFQGLLSQLRLAFLVLFFLFQLLFPWRYVLYKGDIFWTEEGYRYAWRVMLMEKAGTATFYVKDTKTGREGVVDNSEFLNPHQEKQMAMQPDMILQFAHFLAKHYAQEGVHAPQVRAEVYVTLNARPSRLLIDPNVDLTKERDGFAPKKWILHYED